MGPFDTIVIGGGLVGAAIGYGLARRGLKTAILDEGDLAYRASRGNFGLVWVQGKGKGMPQYARWSRFASEIYPDFTAELLEVTGIDVCYSREGGVLVALDEAELQGYVDLLSTLRQEAGGNGYDFDVLDHAALARLLPGLGPSVPGGTFCPHDGHVNPLRLFRALHTGFERRGGTYLANHRVSAIETRDSGFRIHAGGRTLEAAKLVVAAGLGSRDLAASVGLDMPVAPLQGQVMVTERVQPMLDLPTNIIRQTNEGSFLIGYSQDDLGFDTRTDAETQRDIAWRCATAFPFLANLRIVRSWAALRVMTPDGFPIYDRSADHPGVFGVTCHSGVTLAANHAWHVAGWIADGAIPADFACFGAKRFDVQAAA